MHAGDCLIIQGENEDAKGVTRPFLVGRVTAVDPEQELPIAVNWLAPEDPLALISTKWTPVKRRSRLHIDRIAEESVLLPFQLDSKRCLPRTAVDFLREHKLCKDNSD